MKEKPIFKQGYENIDSKTFIKLFDFATDSEFKPDKETESMTDAEILKALGV